jgi:hypothetical protein
MREIVTSELGADPQSGVLRVLPEGEAGAQTTAPAVL